MRTMFWSSILATALISGTACNKKADDTGKAASEVKKAQEDVNEQRKDVRDEKMDPKATTKDVAKQQGELGMAEADLAAARDKYTIVVKDRLAKLDIKIAELEKRADAKSTEAATRLKARRAELATKVDGIKDRTAQGWNEFTKDVDNTFDSLEHDVNDATK